MSNSVIFHKVLTDELISKIGYQEQPMIGYYFLEQEEVKVDIVRFDEFSLSYKIEDPKVVWDALIYEINLIKNIEIRHPQFLFGENGLVGDRDEIGIALRWYSKDASIIEVKEIRSISSEDINVNQIVEEKIDPGTLRGNVVLELILTDKQTGRSLGVLSSKTIIIDGNASLFPIQEVEYKDEPLWWVTLDYQDPLVDTFDLSNVSISLNFAHKNAKDLKLDKGIGSSPLLIEIIAAGLEIIISDVMENSDWESIMNNESDSGSIGAIVYYFVTTLNWDISSRSSLAKSIRADFDQRF